MGFKNGRNHFRIRSLEFSFGELDKVRLVRIVVIGLEVAEHRWLRVDSVVGKNDGLGVAQLHESLHVEAIVALGVVALRGDDMALCERALPVSQLTFVSCPLSDKL